MPLVPLGIGSFKRQSGVLPEVILHNLYLEQDKSGLSPDQTLRIQRPGLVANQTLTGPIRGMEYRESDNEQLIVSGGWLYVDGLNQGFINGSDIAPIVATEFFALIAGGGQLRLWDETLTTVDLPDDAPDDGYVQDIDQLNGYGLILLPGGRFYWIMPEETTVDPLNFATAEGLPDGAVAIRRLGDEFWIFGKRGVEVWQPTGDLDAPFQRAAGRGYEKGCLYRDTVRRFDNTLFWVADDYQVYRASSVPQVISDPGISDRIRRATGDCSAWTFTLDGHAFYVLRIPGQGTFAYDASTQAWSEFSTFGEGVWRPRVGYQYSGIVYAGSGVDGKVYTVNPDAVTDDGAVIERVVTATVPLNGRPPRNDSISVGVGASDDVSIRVRWKDGQDEYPDYYEEIEARAPFDVAQLWRLGQPDQPYRTLEISCVDPQKLTIAGMMVNEAWQ